MASGVIAVLFSAWMTAEVVIVVQAEKAGLGIPIIATGSLPVIWVLIRSMMAAVITKPDGVVVRNIRRSIHLDWSQIQVFALGQAGLLPRVCLVELKDERVIAAWGIQGPNPVTRPTSVGAKLLIDQLNAELVARTQQAVAGRRPADPRLGSRKARP